MDLHFEPLAKACLAAATAKSTSALSASATSTITCPFDGFIVEKVFLLTASTNSLLINSYKIKNLFRANQIRNIHLHDSIAWQ